MRASQYLLTASILVAGMIAGPARAETPEEWITLGTRVHGGFGAFIPLGIRIGLDAVARLDAKPRELAVVYHDSAKSPCACFADGIAIATYASVGQRSLTIASEPAPEGAIAVAVIRPRKGGAGFKYTVPAAALARLGAMNKDLDPRGRYDAVMSADGLFQVEPVQYKWAMNDFTEAFRIAALLIVGFDPELRDIVALSLAVSLTASICAFLIGAPLGTALAVYRFRGRGALIVAANALLGLPPVVVGLVVYLLLSRSGPLGQFGILFTPTAMVIAQAALGVPIVVALVHRMMVDTWAAYGDALMVDGASRLRAMIPIMAIGRDGLLTAFLAAFGRAIAEVGAIIIVGGNIRGYTRTMTTSIALETSKGDLSFALALGIVLIALSMIVSGVSLFFGRALTAR